MPHRIGELNKIAAELLDLGKRANDIGEIQLAKAIVDAVSLAQGSQRRISTELRAEGKPDSDASL
jgi:hypothetical protein